MGKLVMLLAVSVVASVGLVVSVPAVAQTAEIKAKPPMYSYVASFSLPRAKWADLEKQNAAERKLFDKALSDGSLVGYGDDVTVVHTEDGFTHDSYWSSLSLAGVLGMLEELEKGGSTTGAVLSSATKHEDSLLVSRYYNWKPGSFRGAYTHVAGYSFKDGAPDNALDMISKSLGVPLFEKLLAEGVILEYEIDEEQIHTIEPNRFWVIYVCKTADGLDKVTAALNNAFEASPFIGPALDSMVQSGKHRDYLYRTDGAFK